MRAMGRRAVHASGHSTCMRPLPTGMRRRARVWRRAGTSVQLQTLREKWCDSLAPWHAQARQGLGGLPGIAIVLAALAAASVVTLGVFKQGNPSSLAEVPRTLLQHPTGCCLHSGSDARQPVLILLLLDAESCGPFVVSQPAPCRQVCPKHASRYAVCISHPGA